MSGDRRRHTQATYRAEVGGNRRAFASCADRHVQIDEYPPLSYISTRQAKEDVVAGEVTVEDSGLEQASVSYKWMSIEVQWVADAPTYR